MESAATPDTTAPPLTPHQVAALRAHATAALPPSPEAPSSRPAAA